MILGYEGNQIPLDVKEKKACSSLLTLNRQSQNVLRNDN